MALWTDAKSNIRKEFSYERKTQEVRQTDTVTGVGICTCVYGHICILNSKRQCNKHIYRRQCRHLTL